MSAGDKVIRAGLVVSLGVVTVIAIGVSYKHLYDLAKSNGEDGVPAAVLPVTVDGLILATSLVIVNAARYQSRSPVLAWLMLIAGIAATLAGNIAHGLHHGWPGALVAGWPALVAAGCFHLVIGEVRRGRETSKPEFGSDEPQVTGESEPETVQSTEQFVPEPWPEDKPTGLDLWEALEDAPPAPAEPVATTDPLDDWYDETEPESVTKNEKLRNPEAEPETGGHDQDATDPELESLLATARDRFGGLIATGALPSVNAVRREMRVGYPRAVQIREVLDAIVTGQ